MNSKREVLKSILLEANKANTPDLPASTIFFNCINKAYYDIIKLHNNDPTLIALLNISTSFLDDHLRMYVYELFKEKKLNAILDKIEKMQQNNFDDWFLEYMVNKEKIVPWIHPIEKRLKELLIEKSKK